MSPDTAQNSLITFETDEDGTIRVRDELKGQEMRLTTDTDPDLQPALPALFPVPIDKAVSTEVTELTIDLHSNATLQDEAGERLGSLTETECELSQGTYYIEAEGVMKLLVRMEDASFTASYPETPVPGVPLEVSFDEPTTVTIGARSYHDRPEGTITVPDDPAVMLEAISYLGSSITEFTSERSWVTVRSHPPAIERGDRLEVSPALSKPDTGITISVPANYADAYRIAPLAFYFGADVEAGDEAALHLDNGYTETLRSSEHSLEERVDRLLARCLLLDSLTRIGGYFSYPRYEYEELSPHLSFYPQNLYGMSLSDQLMEYLEVPFEILEPYVPKWSTTAVLQPRVEDAALVPYLLDTLSRIHVAESPPSEQRAESEATPSPSTVTAYTHETPPQGASRIVLEGLEHALDRSCSTIAESHSTFVTGGDDRARSLAERIDEGTSRFRLNTDSVSLVRQPTRRELRDVFEAGTDFLYCDLPVSERGFECADGALGPDELPEMNVSMFAISGSESLESGVTLVQNGAIAGLTTEQALSSTQVTRLGNCLLTGQTLAESVRLSGVATETRHRLVGDAACELFRYEAGGVPVQMTIDSTGEDEHLLAVHTPPTRAFTLGAASKNSSTYMPNKYFLCGCELPKPLPLSTSELVSILSEEEELMVRLNGEVYHREVEPTEEFVRESARRALEETE